jgi:branched-chain amino acid transport system permease protein
MVMVRTKSQIYSQIIKGFRPRSDKAFLVLMLVMVCLPILIRDAYTLNVLIVALTFASLAGSWNVICGYTGIFTFGHQAFFGIGAYLSALLSIKAGVSPWLGLVLGGSAAAFMSFLIGLPTLRLRAAPYIAIMTLAFAEIARIVCMNLVGLTRGELGLWGIPCFPDIKIPFIGTISFAGGARIPYFYLILIILGATMLALRLLLTSHIGLAFRAIRDSQDAAESLGTHITKYKLLAFMISAFFAGVVGSFYAHYILILTPTAIFPVSLMIEIMAMTFIGGLGTYLGPILGGILLSAGLEYMRFLGEYRFIIYGALVVIVVIFMPQGFSAKLFREKGIVE